MKRFSKFLTVLLVVSMISPGIAQAAPVLTAETSAVQRLAGKGREETAVAASEMAYKDGAENVVLVGYNGEVDALTGTLLANAKKAPLLITNQASLTETTKKEIARLKAKNVYILGGENVVSEEVEIELKALKYNVKRIEGADREKTAIAVAKEVGGTINHVFLAKGYDIYADALSVGPVSAIKNMPVFLTNTNSMTPATIQAMKDLGVKEVTIVGGEKTVTKKVEDQLKGIKINRISGDDREKTALAVADKFFPSTETSILASGYIFADALVGGYIGAKMNAPILLTNTNLISAETEEFIADNSLKIYVLGGEKVVSDKVLKKIEAAVKAEKVSAISVTGTGDATTITEDKGTLQMVATVTPANASNKSVTWTVTNEDGSATDKATISNSGVLTAVKNGTVKVKATSVSNPDVDGTLVVTISNQEDAAEALAAAKTSAKAALDEYVDAENYTTNAETLAAAIAAGKDAIDAAETTGAVATALANAKSAIDEIESDAEIAARELAVANQAITDAIANVGNVELDFGTEVNGANILEKLPAVDGIEYTAVIKGESTWTVTVKDTAGKGTPQTKEIEVTVAADPNAHIANVSNLDGFKAALADEAKTIINLDAGFETTEKILVNRAVTINGNNKTITFTGDNEGWQGNFVLHVYDTTGVEIKDIKLTGGDAALLVNGSDVTLTGAIDVSNNQFGGIEVSKGTAAGLNDSKLTVTDATLVNTTEAYALPTVWIDKAGGTVVGGTFTENTTVKADQVQFYLVAANSVDETKATATTVAELTAALANTDVTDITVKGILGSESDYTVYNVDRTVTIKGADGAKVFGTFIVKADGVTIDNLAIQNKGDLTGESTTNRGGIYVFAEKITLTNNTITNGLGTEAGLSNAIQIMSSKADNPLSNYVITNNTLIGHDNEVPNWSSSGIVIAQGYKPGSIGQDVLAIKASLEDYQALLSGNTFTNNKIDLTHQDWTTGLEGGPVLYPYPVDETKAVATDKAEL